MPPNNFPTPHLLVRLDRVRDNVARMQNQLGGSIERWQPHLKTTKMPVVWRILLTAGVHRFKCATTREAKELLTLAEKEGKQVELLVAMGHRGSNLQALANLANSHPQQDLSLLSEDPEHVLAVQESSPQLGLWLDLDPGDRRSGIPLEQTDRILATVRAMGSAWKGLHFYEGGERQVDSAEREKACHVHYERLLHLQNQLKQAGMESPALLTSGTPAFPIALAYPGFQEMDHRVGPGTVVFFDGKSQEFGLSGFQPAASVLTRVIARPDDHHFTCDAGSKAVDAANPDPVATIVGHSEWTAMRPSEEHLPFGAPEGDAPPTGTLLELIPHHICPTVNLAEEAVLLDDNAVIGSAPVSARAHATD